MMYMNLDWHSAYLCDEKMTYPFCLAARWSSRLLRHILGKAAYIADSGHELGAHTEN